MADSHKAQDDRRETRDKSGKFLPGNEYAIKPGEVKNPGGRPKKKPITEELEALLEKVNPNDKGKRTNAKIIADVLFELAQKDKKLDAIKEIADRTEGKSTTSVELTGEGGGPIEVDAIKKLDARIAAIARRRKETGSS